MLRRYRWAFAEVESEIERNSPLLVAFAFFFAGAALYLWWRSSNLDADYQWKTRDYRVRSVGLFFLSGLMLFRVLIGR